MRLGPGRWGGALWIGINKIFQNTKMREKRSLNWYMACSACLVCLVSTVSGYHKNALGSASSKHVQNIETIFKFEEHYL